MKKKAKKKSQKTKSQFRNVVEITCIFGINEKDYEFFKFITKASREGRL